MRKVTGFRGRFRPDIQKLKIDASGPAWLRQNARAVGAELEQSAG